MEKIQYKVIRSNRKSIAIIIDGDGLVTVRAPFRIKQSEITEFVDKQRNWILDKQSEVLEDKVEYLPLDVGTGEMVWYLGESYMMLYDDTDHIKFCGSNVLIPDSCTKDDIIFWLKNLAVDVLNERLEIYANKMDVYYSSVKLSNAKTRWGSCSSKNALNFTWRLVMCPLKAIDYVVVHELSHIANKTHSASFWASMKSVIPDYAVRKKWLRDNRGIMNVA
jgi:predicted metal-dependent hydrolase